MNIFYRKFFEFDVWIRKRWAYTMWRELSEVHVKVRKLEKDIKENEIRMKLSKSMLEVRGC